MDSPRMMQTSGLMTALGVGDKNSPPRDSYFWRLWEANKNKAMQMLNSNFVQGIKNGSLDPQTFGAIAMNEAYCSVRAEHGYMQASQRKDNTNQDVQKYFKLMHGHCSQYNKQFAKTWHMSEERETLEKCLNPIKPTKDYADHESEVLTTYPSMFALVAVLPRMYLCSWIAQQLTQPMADENTYSWIVAHQNPESAYVIGNFLEKFTNSINFDKALRIYSKSMDYELEILKTLCNEQPGTTFPNNVMGTFYPRNNFPARNANHVMRENNSRREHGREESMFADRLEAVMMKQEAMMMKHEAAMMKHQAKLQKQMAKLQFKMDE